MRTLPLLFLAACTSSMVNAPGAPGTANAPVNELERPGLVKYLNDGVAGIRAKRRAHAYKTMRAACAGDYRIDAEGPQAADGVVVQVAPDLAASFTSQYWYIQFSCVRG